MELKVRELGNGTRKHTICLNMIVKNESKILTRMFDTLCDIIDCYCICDTGSTDNTEQVITEYFLEKGIPGKVIHEPFKNFAHNRNVALKGCKGMSDYVLLLDADMILKVGPKFDKKALTEDNYHLFQGNEAFYYQNVRIVRNNGLFSYVGVTHEYINTPPRSTGGKVFDKQVLFIHDIGDGGAKSDKFKRDINLLEKGIEDEPGNTRYYFYLGNSYRDYGDDEKAIETYLKQMSMNSWLQEKYCACISIGNIYQKKDDKVNAAKYWLKASEYDNERIEGVVKAAEYYRLAGENMVVNLLYNRYKGYKRNLAEGKLFVEQDKYWDVLEYHNSISAYYVNDKESGYLCCKQILLNSIMHPGLLKSTLENLRFYQDFLLKDTETEREKLLLKVDSLLEKLLIKKSDDEIWRLLSKKDANVSLDRVSLDRVSLDKQPEDKPDNINIGEIYQRIKQYRIDGKSEQAMELYRTIQTKCNDYHWQLEYEYSVFAYYLGIRDINAQVVTVLNKCEDHNIITSVLSNMKFYPDILRATSVHDFTFSLKHKINDVEYDFNSSSSSIIHYNDGYLLNVRLVNYKIDNEGSYIGCDKHVISMYKSIELTKDFLIKGEKLIDIDYVDRRYIGIEDVRFFQDDTSILFMGTGYHQNNAVGMAWGEYTTQDNKLIATDIKPAFNLNSGCEKNWVYVTYKGEIHVIYSWFPLKICKINSGKTLLDLVEEKPMPAIFKNARGSSCGVRVNKNELWFVVHLVSYEKPRQYYHLLAVFDDQLNLLRYSAPFKFEGECIEYCIGLVVKGDKVILPYSTMDRTTKVAVYDKTYVESKLINKDSIN